MSKFGFKSSKEQIVFSNLFTRNPHEGVAISLQDLDLATDLVNGVYESLSHYSSMIECFESNKTEKKLAISNAAINMVAFGRIPNKMTNQEAISMLQGFYVQEEVK